MTRLVAFVIALGACGSKGDSPSQAGETAAPSADPQITAIQRAYEQACACKDAACAAAARTALEEAARALKLTRTDATAIADEDQRRIAVHAYRRGLTCLAAFPE